MIKGIRMNRAQVFEWLCTQLADGVVQSEHMVAGELRTFEDPPDLVDLCGQPGRPTLSQVAAWCRVNPEWKVPLAEAEKIAAARRVNEARKIARRAQGAAQAGGSKLAVDTLLWEAERLDRKYAAKQIIEDAGFDPSKQSEDALVETLLAAILAQPTIIQGAADQLRKVLPAHVVEGLEEKARRQMQLDALEGEVTP